MKLLHDLSGSVCLLLTMVIVQVICLWTFEIEKEIIEYILFMEISMLLCYIGIAWVKRRAEIKQLQECNHVSFLERKALTAKDKEIQRIIKKLEEEYYSQKQSYQKEKKEREQYFQLWIHQIKTPIFAMHMLNEHMQDEKRKKQIRAELFKIERYTQMALSYQRIDDDYIMEKCCLHTIVQEALRTYSTLFIEKGLCLDFSYDEDDEIYTDRKWLCFVIEQLLDNAIKYTQHGTIHVRCSKDEVSIEDEGCGIASEDIVLIKQKGYTGKLGREKKQATGMGLYFVKEICERLHIKWQISSQWQHGTKVSLYPVKERLMDR